MLNKATFGIHCLQSQSDYSESTRCSLLPEVRRRTAQACIQSLLLLIKVVQLHTWLPFDKSATMNISCQHPVSSQFCLLSYCLFLLPALQAIFISRFINIFLGLANTVHLPGTKSKWPVNQCFKLFFFRNHVWKGTLIISSSKIVYHT